MSFTKISNTNENRRRWKLFTYIAKKNIKDRKANLRNVCVVLVCVHKNVVHWIHLLRKIKQTLYTWNRTHEVGICFGARGETYEMLLFLLFFSQHVIWSNELKIIIIYIFMDYAAKSDCCCCFWSSKKERSNKFSLKGLTFNYLYLCCMCCRVNIFSSFLLILTNLFLVHK